MSSMNKSNFVGMIFIVGIVALIFVLSFAFTAAFARTSPGTIPPFPHVSGEYIPSECISCHVRGIKMAPLFDHPDRENCLACHR
ncbi:MAG: hypothetical protein KGZ79_11015 [Dethiobacter sp.]|jgi:hypothetical protein|nr:hypothetical protein [Dethiobacter sp.]